MISGKYINLRLVQPADAAFIVELRTDEKLKKFLSPVSSDVEAQRIWIESYKEKEASALEYYFIIELKDSTPVGAVRVYDLKEDSFSWGSWIIKPGQTPHIAIESAVRIYDFAFESLKYRKARFEVVKENISVTKFHINFGAFQINEDSEYFYYENTYENVQKAKEKYRKFWE